MDYEKPGAKIGEIYRSENGTIFIVMDSKVFRTTEPFKVGSKSSIGMLWLGNDLLKFVDTSKVSMIGVQNKCKKKTNSANTNSIDMGDQVNIVKFQNKKKETFNFDEDEIVIMNGKSRIGIKGNNVKNRIVIMGKRNKFIR